jgi:hypothetical protein
MRVKGAFLATTALLVGTSSTQLVPSATPSSTSTVGVNSSVTTIPTITATGAPCAAISTVVSVFLAERESLYL